MNCFKDELLRYSKLIDGALDKYLTLDSKVPKELIEAMSYSVKAGGKRLRPALALNACGLMGGNQEPCLMPVP